MDSIMATLMLLGLAIGILYKTYLPYARKQKAGTIKTFSPRYVWTAVTAFIGSLMTAMTMFTDAAQAWAEGWPYGFGYFAVFAFGFFWAVGWNYGTNQAFKPAKSTKEDRLV